CDVAAEPVRPDELSSANAPALMLARRGRRPHSRCPAALPDHGVDDVVVEVDDLVEHDRPGEAGEEPGVERAEHGPVDDAGDGDADEEIEPQPLGLADIGEETRLRIDT